MHINQNKMLLAGALAASLAAMSAQAGVTHRYSFTSDASDSVGGANGVLKGGQNSWVADKELNLNSLDSGGANLPSSNTNGGHVVLPPTVLAGATNATVEFWGTFGDQIPHSSGNWCRVFDFGNSINGGGENYIMFTPHSGNGDTRNAFRINGTEIDVIAPGTLDGGNAHHVACVYDSTGGYMELYVDGVQSGRAACSFQVTNVATNNMYIGRSQWGGDEYLYGTIDEFRIYNRAISGAEVAADFLAGPDVATASIASMTPAGAVSTLYLTDPGVIVEKGATNTIATGDFANATGVQLFNLPGFTLTSSATDVLTVTAAGKLKAIKPGTSTLTASYGGKSVNLVVTVAADTVAPTVVSVNPMAYDRFLRVVFSKPLDPVSAQTAANYVIDNGATTVVKAVLNTNDNVTVDLIFGSKVDATSFHTVAVSNVKDTVFTPNVIAPVTTSFFPAAGSPILRRMYYQKNGYNSDAMGRVNNNLGGFNIVNNPDYPHTGGVIMYLANGLTDGGGRGDNVISVIDGYLLPPTSGSYTFFLASDDDSAIYVSTDDTEANLPSGLNYTASEAGWVGTRNYNGSGSGDFHVTQTPVTLNAGSKYYFRYIMRNGTGGDQFDVAWQTPGMTSVPNGTPAIGSGFLADPAYAPVPMTVSGVANQTTYQNQDVTLTATVNSKPAYTGLQWYRNGVAISNATSLSYTLTLPKAADDGSTFYLVASNLVDVVTSAVAKVTVVVDNITPTLVNAVGSSGNQIILTFSERLDATSGVKVGNYAVNGLTVTRADFTDTNHTGVILTTSAQTAGNSYTVTINGVKDLAGNAMANVTGNFIALGTLGGYAYLHWWPFDGAYNNNAGADGIYSYSLTNTPSGSWLVNAFIGTPHALSGWTENMDHYCDVAEGYLLAPETGTYVMHITSDDHSRVYLSTNETVYGLSTNPVAYVNNGWTGGPTDWGSGNAYSTSVKLVAGQRYYYRVVHLDGNGGDGYIVGWEVPSNLGTIIDIPPTNFGVYFNPSLSIVNITNQPVSTSAQATGNATFMVVAGGSSSFGNTVSYQWMSNGVAVAGATLPFYTTPQLTTSANGAVYTCAVSVAGKSVTTTPVTLTVSDTAPVIKSAGAFANSTSVGVRFNKLVDPASAVAATYTVADNTVSSVQFRTNASFDGINGDMVVLTLANAITEPATLTVSGVSDLNGHTTTSASAQIAIISDLLTQDIGTPGTDPLFAGITVPTGADSFQILAGGSDIWDTHDGCQFVYKQVTGDFDIRVRAADLQNSSTWAKVGLMVRESLDTSSRDLNIVSDPTTGANAWECNFRDVAANGSSGWPNQHANDLAPSYPHCWMRLTGIGSVYTAYRSWDGVNWTQLAQLNYSRLPYASQYVGICCTAHNNVATANTIADLYDFSLASISTTPPSMTAKLVGGNLVISWDATLGAGYSLVASDTINAVPAAWTAPTATMGTSGANTTATIPASGSMKFYRLKK